MRLGPEREPVCVTEDVPSSAGRQPKGREGEMEEKGSERKVPDSQIACPQIKVGQSADLYGRSDV